MTPADFRSALERIAQSVAMLPGGIASVSLGIDDEAARLMIEAGGVEVIPRSVELRIGPVTFTAHAWAQRAVAP